MKTKWLYGGLLATAITLPAVGQVSFDVHIGEPPPPLRYEVPPPMPGPGYIWQDGYWAIRGNRWVWVPGVWVVPPYAGAYWSHPHYDRYPDGWHVHNGHWDREDHDEHYWDHHHKH